MVLATEIFDPVEPFPPLILDQHPVMRTRDDRADAKRLFTPFVGAFVGVGINNWKL